MSQYVDRAEFLAEHSSRQAWAALDKATLAANNSVAGPLQLEEGSFAGKRAIILGAGVSGLTTAYELLAQKTGMAVTILEAQNRTGGRCLTLRTGDTLTEDKNSELSGSEPWETQTIRFKQPVGDEQPYLNAGPGRIPSSHKHLLGYLRDFGVAVEVYVMNSGSNLVQMDGGPFNSEPVVYRRLDHNIRGWLAQMVYDNAAELVTSADLDIPEAEQAERAKQLQNLMVSFGELSVSKDAHGKPVAKYAPTAGPDGFEQALARAGFDVLPGVDAGKAASALGLNSLLESEFWKKTRFYQPSDFLWQSTLFQPVGGMDQVQHAFARQVAALGGDIHLNSPVKKIDWDHKTKEFIVLVAQVGTDALKEYRADYCFSNMAMPFLKDILSEKLLSPVPSAGLSGPFKDGLHAVFKAQFEPSATPDKDGYVARFLANTTKVGWQADRNLWQGSDFTEHHVDGHDVSVCSVPDSEIGVVPIFGGISWTSDEIAQIWYPSTGYHDEKGVLTGAYNFSSVAYRWGKKPVQERLDNARKGASKFGEAFGAGLQDGVAIAWQNMPYIKGGWAQWQVIPTEDAVRHFNDLSLGSGIYDENGSLSDPVFFVVGDQLSSLPGWQEGAIVAALKSLRRMAYPDIAMPAVNFVPDTRVMVEGI